MAEKYGVVPKKFTRAWFDHVWTYYKWYIIGVVSGIIILSTSIYSILTKPDYDLDIVYGGYKYFDEVEEEKIEAVINTLADDITGNEKVETSLMTIPFSDAEGMQEWNYTSRIKLDLQFQSEKGFLYIFDEKMAETMLGIDYADKAYVPVSEWTDAKISEDRLYKNEGVAYAVKLLDNEHFKEQGIDMDNLYVAVRQNYLKGEVPQKAAKNACTVASKLFNE